MRFGIHRSTQRREGRLVSRGYMLTPTGSSSLVDATLASLVGATLATLSQYSRAEEVALPGSQVEHDVVQHLVQGQGVFGVSLVVGPGPHLFIDPGRPASRRVHSRAS